MTQFIADHGLDAFTTLLGLLYILLEYRASVWLWLVGIVMPALDIYLYWSRGLYGDAGMAAYYTLAAVYGLLAWTRQPKGTPEQKQAVPITHFPVSKALPVAACFFVAWGVVYWILIRFTNSTIPATDAFTNALSFVGLWALARKYAEQWLVWIVVDVVSFYLYVVKGIPFKAFLYGLYVVIAVLGYRNWVRQIGQNMVEKRM